MAPDFCVYTKCVVWTLRNTVDIYIRNTIGYSSPSSWKMLTFCTDMRKKWCELLEIHIRVFNDVSIADSTSGSVGLVHNHSDLLARRQNESIRSVVVVSHTSGATGSR